MKRKLSAVAALNQRLEPEGLRLCINRERRIDRGFFYIERIGTGELVRSNVDLHKLGYWLSNHGTLPPRRFGEDLDTIDNGGPFLPPGP